MAVAVRVILKIILVIFLGGKEVYKRSYFHKELLAPTFFDRRDALYRLFRRVACVIDSGLILRADIVALPVFDCGINDIEVSEQKCVETHLVRIVFHANRLPEAGFPFADCLVIGVFLAGAVRVAALCVDDSRDRLHQLFHAPKTAAREIDDVFGRLRFHTALLRLCRFPVGGRHHGKILCGFICVCHVCVRFPGFHLFCLCFPCHAVRRHWNYPAPAEKKCRA